MPGAIRLNTASSIVTGRPSLHFMPARSFTSTWVGVGRVTFSAAQGCASPSGPMRISLSHTISAAQLPCAPEMLKGLRLVGVATEFRITSFCSPSGLMFSQVQVLRAPMPAWVTIEFSSNTALLKATTFFGCTMKP